MYKNLIELSNNQFVWGSKLTKVENSICDLYQLGKLKHISHKKVDSPYTLKPLELIYMDLMGPIKLTA